MFAINLLLDSHTYAIKLIRDRSSLVLPEILASSSSNSSPLLVHWGDSSVYSVLPGIEWGQDLNLISRACLKQSKAKQNNKKPVGCEESVCNSASGKAETGRLSGLTVTLSHLFNLFGDPQASERSCLGQQGGRSGEMAWQWRARTVCLEDMSSGPSTNSEQLPAPYNSREFDFLFWSLWALGLIVHTISAPPPPYTSTI